MNSRIERRRSVVANSLYALLNPIPFGFFVAALIFDVTYFRSGTMLWNKGAAWLIAIGLVFAVIPRVVNLMQVWITSRHFATSTDRLDFWLNLLAIVAAIFNAFVHSRDAFAVMPTGLWLSVCTVALLAIGRVAIGMRHVDRAGVVHE